MITGVTCVYYYYHHHHHQIYARYLQFIAETDHVCRLNTMLQLFYILQFVLKLLLLLY